MLSFPPVPIPPTTSRATSGDTSHRVTPGHTGSHKVTHSPQDTVNRVNFAHPSAAHRVHSRVAAGHCTGGSRLPYLGPTPG